MVGIQINGEFLDLAPGTTLELVKENPFLQFDNFLLGDYSLPFQVIANAKNMRLLNYAAIAQQRLTSAGIEAMLYDKSIQIATGKVKIQKPSININQASRGLISCYFLSGAGGFWQDAKDKKLREANMGGVRSFAWAGLSTITDGFWRHIHQVAAGAVGAYDYAIFPVQNQGWIENNEYPPVMNMMYYDVAEAFPVRIPNTYVGLGLDVRERNRIVPFPYLKYVLTKAVAYTGWSIDGDILDDDDFKRIVMINFRAIDWCHVVVTGGTVSETARNPVEFNLQDHLPDITVSNFLLALRNRFGWRFDFDNTSKKITIHTLADLATTAPVDYTRKSSPLIEKNVLQDLPVYALRNNFATSIGDGKPDFKVIDFKGNVDINTDLPAAAESRYGHVYLAIDENNYYICLQNPEDEIWQWYPYTYNIYDYEPPGFNAEIITDATLVGNERFTDYLDFIPRIDNQGEWNGRTDEAASWGIHLVFYFGQRNNKSNQPLPYASHHIYDSKSVQVGNWSLAFKALKKDDTEVGLYDRNWKPFLNMLQSHEEVEHTLYLPLHEYLQLRFSQRIVVAGVELFIKQINSSIPYKGAVRCVSIRV